MNAQSDPTPIVDNPEQDSSAGPRSVHRALEILTQVTLNGPLTLGQLSKACGLASSTTLRNLRALEHWQFVSRTEDNRYEVGARFVESRIIVDRSGSDDLVELSKPVLEGLTDSTSESSYLAIPGPAGTCIYLREVQSREAVRYVGFSDWAGRAVSSAGSAVGDALSGRVSDEGYCVRETVVSPDAMSVAAPVHGVDGEIIAAVSIAGPAFRMQPSTLEEYGLLVVEAASELERATLN